MRALVVLIISGISKKFTSLLRLQPPHMFMTVVICAFLQYLQLNLIIHQSFDDQQMQKQSITIGGWQVLGKFNVMASRAGISLWWYRSLASPGQSPGHWFRPSWPPARAPGGTRGNFQLRGSKLVIDVPHNSKTPISRQSIHLINSRLFQMTTFKFRFSKLKNQSKVHAGKNCSKRKTQKIVCLDTALRQTSSFSHYVFTLQCLKYWISTL